MTNNKQPPGITTPSEQHHGDLRKRAFLKRRADYQMQAQSGSIRQAGAAVSKRRGHD